MKTIIINQDNFETEVMQSDVPVLLDFWAPWCGPCLRIAPILDELAEQEQGIKVGKINVDECLELKESFGVSSIPLLVVMKDGKVVNHGLGAMDKESLLEMIMPYKEAVSV